MCRRTSAGDPQERPEGGDHEESIIVLNSIVTYVFRNQRLDTKRPRAGIPRTDGVSEKRMSQ